MKSRSEKSATTGAPHSLHDAADLAGNLCQRREFLLERLTSRRSRNADSWNHSAERGLIVRSHPGPGILRRMHHELAVRGLYGRLFPRYHVTGAGAAKHNAVDAPTHRPKHHWLLGRKWDPSAYRLDPPHFH